MNAMDRDCGWVELLRGDGDGTVGRGRLVVTNAPGGPADDSDGPGTTPGLQIAGRGQLDAGDGEWDGRIDPLRVEDAGAPPRPGDVYRIRFEENGQILAVRLREWEPLEEGHGQALVEGRDGELPTVLLEVGGD